MSSTALFAAITFAALQLFVAGLALQETLSSGVVGSAGATAARIAAAPAVRD
jgi:hypothetical protein